VNERIKEFAKQAGAQVSRHTLTSYPVQYRESIELWDNNIEKFAELIVRECMSLVSEPGPDMNDTERGILAQIKEHFGVEE